MNFPLHLNQDAMSGDNGASVECCVCFETANMRRLNCGHMVCSTCIRTLRGTTCPMCWREIGSELALLRCINEASGKSNFAIPIIDDRDRFVFSEQHYPTGIGFEDTLPHEDFFEVVRELNHLIRSSEFWVKLPLCILLPCLHGNWGVLWSFVAGHGVSQLLARQLVLRAIQKMNRQWSAEDRSCHLQLSKGFWMDRCSLYLHMACPYFFVFVCPSPTGKSSNIFRGCNQWDVLTCLHPFSNTEKLVFLFGSRVQA